MQFKKLAKGTTAGFLIGAVAVFLLSTTPAKVQAQAEPWAVWENCVNGPPCIMGVAQKSYAPRGSANYLAGWRQKSQFYKKADIAWRTACFWHYGGAKGVIAPDIARGRFNCSLVCDNGTCR